MRIRSVIALCSVLVVLGGCSPAADNRVDPDRQAQNNQSAAGKDFYSESESRQLARNWIKNKSLTYTYDGFGLKFREARALDTAGCEDCYEFDFAFKSRHGGFGNREGKMVTQAITPHIITVWVEHGKVTRALTDNEFNEMTGRVRQGGQGVDRLQPREVKLYYYNPEKDRDQAGRTQCSRNSLQAVTRLVPGRKPAREAVEALLAAELKPEEKARGLVADFGSQISLTDLALKDKVAILQLEVDPHFSMQSNCQVKLLGKQIKQTLLQFKEIEEVRIKPKQLFSLNE